MTEQLAYARHEQALKTSCVLFDKKAQCQDAYEHFFFFQILFSLKNRNPYSHAVLRAPQAASPSQVLHYRLPVQWLMVIHRVSDGGKGGCCQCACLDFLADIFGSSKGTDVFGKEAIKSRSSSQEERLHRSQTVETSEVWQRDVPSHVP